MSSDRWLTHAEAAECLGLTIGSLRSCVRDKGWAKGTDSQGAATFLVPADAAAKGQKRRFPAAAEPDPAEPSPDLIISQRRCAELEADASVARQERDQARAQCRRESERADRFESQSQDVAQQQADMAALRKEADVLHARVGALEAHIVSPRAGRDDRISLLEKLIRWHRKSWWRQLFEEPPVVWLPEDRGFAG